MTPTHTSTPEKPVVLVADPLPAATLAALSAYDVRRCDGGDPAALREAVRDAHALLIRSGTTADADAIAAAPHLKIISRAGVGLDNVDVAAATRAGVLVANAPQSNVLSVAELTVALIISSLRKVYAAGASLRAGRWERSAFKGGELAGRRVGIVGLGNVGRLVARRLAAFDVELYAYDPFVTAEQAQAFGARSVELDELMSACDIVTVHLPKNPATLGLIGERELRLARPTLHLVNTSRGGIVDERALAEALAEGRIAGAALDVFETEPATGSPLLDLDTVTATPHLGASTAEAQDRAGHQAVESVCQALEGRPVPLAMNAGDVAPAAAAVPAMAG
ncbi:hydroxyacid dehydrogenase [Streptomyces sp. CT34]|uniref:hydroxyacid dehydrogenase n=1 Tax=Streptomyces sp. CT34 TaxID=1553907 RepID=UPI0006892AB6|nr:hydroxyacid dehydrogenase [Streptomyces sp. CT34]